MSAGFDASRRRTVQGLGAGAASVAFPGILRAQTLSWIASSNAAMTDPTAEALNFFASRVGELTQGQIQIATRHGNTLGDDRAQIEAMLQGAIQLTTPPAAFLGAWYKPAEVFNFPYIFKDAAHKDRVMSAIAGEFSEGLASSAKMRVLAVVPRMGRSVTSNKVIRVPGDMKGLKIRVPPTKIWVRSFQLFGASPTPLPFPEVFQGLKTGLIDGQENPLVTSFTNGMFDANRNLNLTEHMFADNVIVLTDATFRTLSPAHLKAVREAGRNMEERFRPQVVATDKDVLEKIRAKGIAINDVDKVAFAATVANLSEEFPDVKPLLQRIRAVA